MITVDNVFNAVLLVGGIVLCVYTVFWVIADIREFRNHIRRNSK